MPENGVVTVFCLDEARKSFVRKGCFGAWIHKQKRVREQTSGVRRCDTFDVRISLPLLDEVNPGDLLYFGKTDVLKMSECRRIAAVRKNDYGTFRHWHIEAEYVYR
ncbi:MAG: hypothetical protein IKW64_01110 [Clostridia bacterium]|nr:hypothetical protein [Clostridia bacterium]